MKNIFKVNDKFKLIPFIISILIPLGGGVLAWYITKDPIALYETLTKPKFSLPGWLFGIVWTTLYILIGFALYRIYMTLKEEKRSYGVLILYFVQFFISLLSLVLFFNLKLYGLSAISVIIVIILIIIFIIKFIKIDKISSVLLIPYLIWCSYAAYLNIVIWMLNEM